MGQHALQNFAQQPMINGWKELFDIALQHIWILAGQMLTAVDGKMSAFADAVGVAVGKKLLLVTWHSNIAQGMMHHAVTEGRRRDEPAFGLVDVKTVVAAGLITAIPQLTLQGN